MGSSFIYFSIRFIICFLFVLAAADETLELVNAAGESMWVYTRYDAQSHSMQIPPSQKNNYSQGRQNRLPSFSLPLPNLQHAVHFTCRVHLRMTYQTDSLIFRAFNACKYLPWFFASITFKVFHQNCSI